MKSRLLLLVVVGLVVGLVGQIYGGEMVLQCDAGTGALQAGWTQVVAGLNSNVAGTGINVTLATGNPSAIAVRNPGGTGPLANVEADFYFANDENYSPGNDFILTLSGLSPRKYVLRSYHNRPDEGDTTIANVAVTGATGVVAPATIVQTHAIMDNPAVVEFSATGSDVVINYQGPTGGGNGCQAFFNGFTLESGTAVVEFDSAASGALEGISPAALTVILTEAQTQAVTVDYSVTGGSAASGQDYSPLTSGTLTFNQGETAKIISIAIISDGIDENDETIEVTLANVTGGGEVELGGVSVHTYTIMDPRPSVQFSAGADSGPENVQIMHRPREIAVDLSQAAASVILVNYAVTGGSAIQGTDYTIAGGASGFAAGETAKDVGVSIIDDALDESDETIVLGLSNAVGAKLGPAAQHTYTIIDDDPREPYQTDINSDGFVDAKDLHILIENWLETNLDPSEL